ncbi:MAG: hypothetical protein KGL43_28385, partial [Burkholderiales bacterium]|nr:hypothetical protein [Burkholderiales bacterium]
LRLDPAEALVAPAGRPASAADVAVEQALQAVAEAASAAREAASAASASQERLAALERTVEQLRADQATSLKAVAAMHDRLVAAESRSRFTMPLLLAFGALALLSGWLGWRLSRLQDERRRSWQLAADAADATDAAQGEASGSRRASPLALRDSAAAQAVQAAAPLPAQAPAWPPAAPLAVPELPLESVVEHTDVLPPRGASSRDVTIEELLDLEQQAEFFIVLGQDEAAIDLLIEHVRSTGGSSPLPYLKLLEIYRRRNEREAYERMRARFNHRFNAYAPAWEVDLQHGLALDDYPSVTPRLQQVWARPLDAMAELEALLFRKSRGELFDLPAYREVLFLYSIARDLLDREAVDTSSVDLLLPLADGGEFSSTSPHPYFGSEVEPVFDSSEDRATSPVDLDLSQPEDTPSIFRHEPSSR